MPDRSSSSFASGYRVLGALVAALVAGSLIAASGNESALRAADLARPVGVLWINAIRMTVIPLVVSLLIVGVTSIAELGSLGRTGARTIGVFATLLVVSAVVSALAATALFSLFPWEAVGPMALPPGAEEAAREVAASRQPTGLVDFIISAVPANPIAAAVEGNMVALIVFAVLVALAASQLSQPAREPLVSFFRSLSEVMLQLVRWVIALAPVAVFALVLPLAARSGALMAGAFGFYMLIFATVCLVITAVLAVLGGLRSGLREFVRAALPAQLIGMSSSSSIATLPAMVESAGALGLPGRVSGFVLPLAVSIFKPAAAPAWICGALFVGRFYGIDVTGGDVLLIAAASVLVSFAAPGVPRGAFLLLTPLFLAIGLPAEGIGVLIALDAIPDVFATVVNVTGDISATAIVARSGSSSEREPPTS
ncbi:MAG: dicarboxylate/amino acid:cation symporter [Gemmatimonadota bacterium]